MYAGDSGIAVSPVARLISTRMAGMPLHVTELITLLSTDSATAQAPKSNSFIGVFGALLCLNRFDVRGQVGDPQANNKIAVVP